MRYLVSLLPSTRLGIAWQRALDPVHGRRLARRPSELVATNTATDPCRHLYMHPAHPDFQGECAVAHVDDRGDAAELAIFAVLVPGVDIDDLELEELNGT